MLLHKEEAKASDNNLYDIKPAVGPQKLAHAPVLSHRPVSGGSSQQVAQFFKITKPGRYIPLHMRSTQGADLTLWDSEWDEATKRDNLQQMSPRDFDTLTSKLVSKMREEEENKEAYMRELDYVLDLYNNGHNALSQSKTMEDAPHSLALSDSEVHGESVQVVKEQIEELGKDKGFSVYPAERAAKYFEDVVEVLRSGYIGTRISISPGANALNDSILRGRRNRWEDKDYIPKGEAGGAAEDGSTARTEAESLLRAIYGRYEYEFLGENHVYLRCPIEGGNMLTGSDFIIVGMDALYATMDMYNVDEATARGMMAKDFNIAPEKVYIIEQPGEFHLDMAMTLVKNDTVLMRSPGMNDRGTLIKMAAEQLSKYGFKIIFDDGIAAGYGYNFLNGEFVRAGDGKVYYITNSPEESFLEPKKVCFKKFMLDHFGGELADVIFIDGSFSSNESGGLGCRVKGVPGKIEELVEKRIEFDKLFRLSEDTSTWD